MSIYFVFPAFSTTLNVCHAPLSTYLFTLKLAALTLLMQACQAGGLGTYDVNGFPPTLNYSIRCSSNAIHIPYFSTAVTHAEIRRFNIATHLWKTNQSTSAMCPTMNYEPTRTTCIQASIGTYLVSQRDPIPDADVSINP